MSSVSGLSRAHRLEARRIVAHGAGLMLAHPQAVHYSMGSDRWEGIDRRLLIARGQYPKHSDCSSSSTWLLWNALAHTFGVRDVVNGTAWRAGYTGTIAQHGKLVAHDRNLQVGDLLLYGPAPIYEHVAVYMGGGKVFSHGSEPGPYLLDMDYRRDRGPSRRFI